MCMPEVRRGNWSAEIRRRSKTSGAKEVCNNRLIYRLGYAIERASKHDSILSTVKAWKMISDEEDGI